MHFVKQAIVHNLLSIPTWYSQVDLNTSVVSVLRLRSNFSQLVYGCLALIYFAFFTSSFAQASEADSNAGVATVDFVKGYVAVYPGNDTTVALFAKRDMQIAENDFIVTGDDGFVSLSFRTGTVVNIQPSSEVRIDELDCAPKASHCNIVLDASKGAINSNVKRKAGDAVKFTIKTPYATAAVRGTVFDVEVSDSRLLAGVTEGQVNVAAASGQVELPENFGTQVRENQPPSDPKPLLVAPIFSPGPNRYESGGEVAWESVAMAEQYLVSFDNASGLVYREQSAETIQPLSSLELGTYAMRIRAIDDEGFKGQAAQREFDVVKTNTSRSGPSVSATVGLNDYSVLVQQQAIKGDLIELNFSPTDKFEQLINLDVLPDEVVSAGRAKNSIFVRARVVLSNTEVTPFGPTLEIPGLL